MTAEADRVVLPFDANKPTASFVPVTPEVAQRWLERNGPNRLIRKTDVDRYKRDMLAGRWHLEGSPVRFAPDGALLDGQHRLTAIVQTGVTLPMLVVRGIDPAAQAAMDTGRRRTAADALAIRGYRHSALSAAVARILLEVKMGRLDAAGNRFEVSHDEIIDCLETNSDITSAVDFTNPLSRRTDCPPSVVAYTYLIMRRIDPQAAAEFWVGMAEKVGLREGDPILALSNRLADARRNREQLTRRMYLSLVYRAWNTRRRGHTMRFLRLKSAKGGIVPIPEPI